MLCTNFQRSWGWIWIERGIGMLVTFQDELGVLSLKIDDKYGVTFGANKVFFTDENGNDYKVNVEHLISITKAEWRELQLSVMQSGRWSQTPIAD